MDAAEAFFAEVLQKALDGPEPVEWRVERGIVRHRVLSLQAMAPGEHRSAYHELVSRAAPHWNAGQHLFDAVAGSGITEPPLPFGVWSSLEVAMRLQVLR